MRKALGILICLALLLGVGALAEAGNGFIGEMTVVNCEEWVSMRAEPDTSAERLIQVPLGALVEECSWYSQEFIYGTYDGVSGYILAEYLEANATAPVESEEPGNGALGDIIIIAGTNTSLYQEADLNSAVLAEIPEGAGVTNCHQYNAEFVYCEYEGQIGYVRAADVNSNDPFQIFERISDGLFLRAERSYDGSSETLEVRVTDAAGDVIWNTTILDPAATELEGTTAFVNANGGDAMVMLYNAAEGLTAADAATGDFLWTLSSEEASLGASIHYAIDGYGTMYIGGAYGPDPVAISREGEVLWQADSGRDDVFWLYEIALDENDGVIAYYDMIGEHSGYVCYGWDGQVKWISES